MLYAQYAVGSYSAGIARAGPKDIHVTSQGEISSVHWNHPLDAIPHSAKEGNLLDA